MFKNYNLNQLVRIKLMDLQVFIEYLLDKCIGNYLFECYVLACLFGYKNVI